ncbi:MAG: hypothetical protein QHJ82_02285, partial [Verrucomicrobiota bacterium]|nr:hypothetical protein [Verrucomicrobiota bacterium]
KLKHVADQLEGGGNIVFRLAGDNRFVHERPEVMRAWEACKLRFEQKGETLDWVSLMAGPVPDGHNFLATPALAPCFGFGKGSDAMKPETSKTNACQQLTAQFEPFHRKLPGQGDWRSGTLCPLADWASELPKEDLEKLRSLFDENRNFFAEVRTAARRPFAQIKLSPELVWGPEGPLSEQLAVFRTFKSLGQVFSISARLNLLGGNAESACSDIESILAFGEAAGSQPLLIGFLVKVSLIELGAQPLWSGLADRRWPESQLARLESRLGQVNLVADYRRCMRGERSLALAMLGAEANIGVFAATSSTNEGSQARTQRTSTVFRGWPRALIYRNQISVAEGFHAFLEGRVDPARPSVRLSPAAEHDPALDAFKKASPYNFLFPRLFHATGKTIYKAAAGQTTVTLARVACALERHRLAKGRYPETLAELAPGFISRVPADPVNGGPLKYRLIDQDRYVLYSVGPDGVDDGGKPISKAQVKEDVPAGDWVWQSPEPKER